MDVPSVSMFLGALPVLFVLFFFCSFVGLSSSLRGERMAKLVAWL